MSISAAFQETYMSLTTTAVPKFGGKTLLRQFETAYFHPEAPIVMITGWNEWIVRLPQRFCPDGGTDTCNSSNDSFSNGNKVFVDEYNYEYSRDLEPGGGGLGSYYYDLMKNAISLLRSGRNPMDSTLIRASASILPR